MRVVIKDDGKKLSPTQMKKLKDKVKDILQKGGDVEEAFQSIYYPTGVTPYTSMHMKREDDLVTISFDAEEQRKADLRLRLKERLRGSRGTRDPKWAAYLSLKDRSRVPLPTPTEISQNASMFQGLVEKMNSSDAIREYFELCLDKK